LAQVAVITGASAGVGRACARAFAERRCDLGLLARGRADSAVEQAATHIEQDLGPSDVWVNNAMASVFAPFLEMTAEEFERVAQVTCLGQMNGTRAALRRMVERDNGSIVEVGSALAYRSIPLQSAYCASKHAVPGLCDSVRAELLHDGSNVSISMVQLPALTRRSSTSSATRCGASHSRFHRSSSRRSRPRRSSSRPRARSARCGWVGVPAIRAIFANRLFPGVLDRLLALQGYGSQQCDEPSDAEDSDVLFSPFDRDLGAHGSFDDRARPRSRQVDLNVSPRLARLRQSVGRPASWAFARVLTQIM
jgi:short-subunit dehydrogenase